MNKEFVKQLHGLSCGHIDMSSLEKPIHHQCVGPIRKIKADAKAAGFDLQVVSGFRDFERQRLIWNGKLQGSRPVYDSDEQLLNLDNLSIIERIYAVMRWSAIPGASRHHWGTEIDIFDASSLPEGYQLELKVEETRSTGVMGEFYQWLDYYLEAQKEWFRPYAFDKGGVAPEPWHLSFQPLAVDYEKAMNCESLSDVFQKYEIAHFDTVLKYLPELYQRFIMLSE